MKITRCLGIEPAENGWVVVETVFHEEDREAADTVEHSSYDPSAAFGESGREDGPACLHKTERVHVFTDHTKLMAFLGQKTAKTD